MDETLNLTRQIREAEFLKGEIVCATGNLYKMMAEGEDIREIKNTLGEMILDLFCLGDKLGISAKDLNDSIVSKLRLSGDKNTEVYRHFLAGKKQGKGF